LCRRIKFHRLVCDIESRDDALLLRLDGPLSLFSATQKYGLQLALFLPAIVACPRFELTAELRWGPQRKEKTFVLTHEAGLIASGPDPGQYVPPELTLFVDLFRKKITSWELAEEAEIFRLGNHFWVPDFRLTENASRRVVYLEVLGFWRRSSLGAYLERLRRDARMPFVLAVSDQLHVEDEALAGMPIEVHRFRNMPLPDEIVRLAGEVLAAIPA
jgi:predicted nuclease of restriction endonuclease-like RecB superfamily